VRELANDFGWLILPQSFLFQVIKHELTYWMAFSQLEPFGSDLIESAKLQSAIYSVGSKEYVPPSNFLPCLAKEINPDDPEQIEKDWQMLDSLFGAI
jgi:hypothetical protein